MVELFAPPDLLEYPSLVIGPAPTVTRRRFPTPAHVERTFVLQKARTPWADLQIFVCKAVERLQAIVCSPTLRHDGLDLFRSRSVRIAPVLFRGVLSDRTLGLLT